MFSRSVCRLALVGLAVVYVVACGTVAPSPSPTTSPTAHYSMTASLEVGPPCEHLDSPYSDRICPDTMLSDYFHPADVTAETLVVHTATRTVRLAMPNRTDAIFLSKSALETFLLRHYDATDAAKARQLRDFIAARYH